mgnify:CR=1 FL=1
MAKRSKGTRRQTGLLPGESRRRSLVKVERVSRPNQGEEGLTTFHNYIVETHRLDGVWRHTIEYQGQSLNIPGKAVDAINRQRQAIITEEHSRRAIAATLAAFVRRTTPRLRRQRPLSVPQGQ